MKKQTSFWGRLCIALTLLFFTANAGKSMAQPFTPVGADSIGKWWGHSINITSRAYPTLLSNTNYDDWNFPQTADGSAYYFNCQRQWMFTGYTTPDDSFDVVLDRNLTISHEYFDVYVYKSYPVADTIPVATYLNKHITDTFLFKSADPSLYTFKIFPQGSAINDSFLLMQEYLVLLPRIKKLWIEADPVCAGPYATGTYYNFQVKSDPDLSTIWDHPTSLGYLNVISVPSWPTHFSNIVCDNSFSPWDMRMRIWINDAPLNTQVYPTNPATGETEHFNLNNRFGVDLTDYRIDHSYIADWVSPLGSFYGLNPIINVDFNDNIATHHVLSAPIIVKTPTGSIPPSVNPTATPPTDFPGPPNAIGIPSASFDVYDYNVAGNETWTPTSNPFATMAGPGSTVSTVRVQHRLKIPAGASLALNGMRLEFAPDAQALVENASSPTGHGGTLSVVNGSVLTAYRGCDGTDHATWAGVRLQGSSDPIPLDGGGGLDFWNMPHGKINIRNSTISYAEAGILCNGGAGVIAYDVDFINNKITLIANPYHNIISGVEYRCALSVQNSRVTIDNNAWFIVNKLFYLADIRGFWAGHNTFSNLSGAVIQKCVEAYDAGFTLWYNEFNNFSTAVSSSYLFGTSATCAVGNTFNKNWTGVDIIGGIAPIVAENNFNIPPNPPTTSAMYYPGTGVLMLSSHNIGALLRSTTGYNVLNNVFRKYGPPLASSTVPSDYITGTLEYNTGSDPNQVVKNDFAGLGTAMLSNFVNRSAAGVPEKGLRYLCNKENNVVYDIAVCGNDILDGGIDLQQLTNPPGIVAVASAGNKLGGAWNMFNQQQYIAYSYKNLSEQPITWSGFGAATFTSYDANCLFPSPGAGPYASYRSATSQQASAYTPGANNPVYLRYAMANANVNYCLTDTLAVDHSDSLYFWASEINTAYGDLLTACLLINDSLIDSANAVYNAIASKYSLDSPEVVDFIYGRDLMDILIALKTSSRNITELDSPEIVSLENIRSNTRMWAHARSSAWLRMLRGDAINDTLLYPEVSDSALQSVTPPGVLALTELSLGATHGCQYAEVLVTSCQGSGAPEVDVRGWLINDNSGLFSASDPIQNPAGDCSENVGITPGHYRLKYDDVWKRVPVGSFIVLYNKDENCYNMPDTFTVDSNYVYWVPVGTGAGDNHIEKYTGSENQNGCSYCSDTGSTVYVDDSLWMNTNGLDSLLDGLQVLCPGCSPSYTAAPTYYHGVGYGAESESNGQMQLLPVLKSGAGFGKKYVFNGAGGSDLVLDSSWTAEDADSAGAIPTSVGNVNATFYNAVVEHSLSLPCCAVTQQQQQKNARDDKEPSTKPDGLVVVYPNPARMVVKFEFPVSKQVTVRISDVMGRTIIQKTSYNASMMTLSVRDFVPGVYIYNITAAEKTQSGKIVIGE